MFIDDKGATQTVQGIGEIGRGTLARAFDAGYRLGMPCPRVDCGGRVVADIDGNATCTLCARGEIVARPPTKKEAGDKRHDREAQRY